MVRPILLAGLVAILPAVVQAQGRGMASAGGHAMSAAPRAMAHVSQPVGGAVRPAPRGPVRNGPMRPRTSVPGTRIARTNGERRFDNGSLRSRCRNGVPGLGFDEVHLAAVCGPGGIGGRGFGNQFPFFPFFNGGFFLPYFPVDMSAMSAKRKFKEVEGGDSFQIGENKITARWLNHPQGCLGFRIETPAGTVAYATDNEPGDVKLDESLRELVAGADIFINDAQFTPEQLETTRKGWGHSSWLEGVKVARHAGAKTLVLFHHDPDSTDRMVDSILRQAREEFDSVFAASEGMVITLGAPGDRVQAHMPGTRTALRREAQFNAKVCGVTEGGKDFEEETVVRDLSLQGALISLKHLPRLQSELQVTMEAPGADGVQSMKLRGYVVRIDSGAEKGRIAVGVVFTD